ncbi:hypothetical protein [Streptomyces laurentii]|uniref:hypothetical protein n=1 Tax=Streptomyces laurentii TaxID=39478 RepID=UPI0036C6F155
MMRGPLRRVSGVLSHTAPDPAGPLLPAGGPGKRILAALSALVLLLAGFWAYGMNSAPSARAVTPSTTLTGGMAVSVAPGSVSVGLLTISATVTYTCTDTGAVGGNAVLRVQFTQGAKVSIGGALVPCGASETNQTQNVSAAQLGMSGSQAVTVSSTLVNGSAVVTSTASALVHALAVHQDQTATFPGDGSVMLTGTYTCSSDVSTPGTLFVTARQVDSGNEAVAGTAMIPVTTCDGTSQPWSVDIAGTSLRGRAAADFSTSAPISGCTSATIPTVGGSSPVQADTSIDYRALLG